MSQKIGVPQHLFKDITLPHKGLPDASKMRYRVYKDKKEFVSVEADNAKAALQASGFEKAIRIERENIMRVNILPFALSDKEEKEAPKEAAPAEKEAPAAQASTASPPTEPAADPKPAEEAAAQPAAEQASPQAAAGQPKAEANTPLSSDDVNNLLKS